MREPLTGGFMALHEGDAICGSISRITDQTFIVPSLTIKEQLISLCKTLGFLYLLCYSFKIIFCLILCLNIDFR